MQRVLVAVFVAALALFSLPAIAESGASTTNDMTAARVAPGIGAQQPGIAFEAPAQRDHDLDVIASAGMTWVRADFYWSAIQAGGRSSLAWGPVDAFVQAARA